VKLELNHPRINIENKVHIYPHGIVSSDDYLKEQVSGFLKEHGLYFREIKNYKS
jgi:hypothetical protein